MKKQSKKEVIITGTMVARGAQVLAILVLCHHLIMSLMGQQALDMTLVALSGFSVACLEVSFQGNKKETSND